LTEIDRQQVEQRLHRRAEEIAALRAQVRSGDAELRDAELADYDQHPADEGTETHDQELDETTDLLLAEEQGQVELALRRLAEGQYGRCVDCGREIPAERLQAVPEAVRCIDDQARYEAMLRARGIPPQRAI
jgi:RNA polymerase-binding transcription factor DksA